jgi:hypothetical protein
MASIDDEKLVLHVRERLVVHDLLEAASPRLGGQCGRPDFERRSVEGTRQEVGIFSWHQLWRKGGNGLWTEWGLFRHPMGWESKQEEVSRPWMMAASWFAPTSYVTLWHGHYLEWSAVFTSSHGTITCSAD